MKKLPYIGLCLLFLLVFPSCTQQQGGEPSDTPPPTAEEAAKNTPSAIDPTTGTQTASAFLVGFVIPEGTDIALCTLKHGFLRTAETLGYPSKLYYADAGSAAVAAVEQAASEGCRGLLIYSPNDANTSAIARAEELGIPVVTPYHEASGARANVVADVNGYLEEVALGVAERMVERKCQSGRILVYGREPQQTYEGFREAIAEYYPQYTVVSFTRRAATEQAAIDELATFLLWNRDIKGLFCPDIGGETITVQAREKARGLFRSEGAPETSGLPAPPGVLEPNATPAPEGLTSSIIISTSGYGFSSAMVRYMRSNDIYAFVLEPYYEASAQSLMLLDRILNGESVPEKSRLNMPIVRMATLDKYMLIDEQVRVWFQLEPLDNT